MRRLPLILLFATAASAQPLSLRTQGPLRELFLDMPLFDARPLLHPELDVRWSMANTWNAPMVLERGGELAVEELDEQADSLSVRLRVPWRKRFWTAVELRFTAHWGGWSDRPIEAWHSLIGAFNYQRAAYPRDQVRLQLADRGGTAFDVSRGTAGFGDLAVRSQAVLLETAAFALAGRFDFKLPVGSLSRATGSGGIDAGAGVAATWQAAPHVTLHGMVSLSRFSNLSAPTDLQPKPWHAGADASLELSFAPFTFLIEDRVLSPLFMPGWNRVESGGDEGLLASGSFATFRAHNQISFGVRGGPLSVWLSEDFTPGSNPRSTLQALYVSNAPDVLIGASWTQPL